LEDKLIEAQSYLSREVLEGGVGPYLIGDVQGNGGRGSGDEEKGECKSEEEFHGFIFILPC